jgi:prepilin-type N-terminal cleavage/methylation domain-containing protein
LIQNLKFKILTLRVIPRRGKNSPQAAFTLIEMLVVVFVLGIGLIGALSFFNINLNNQFEAKNELIAAGLAQEGADLVRNIKDYNQLNSSSGLKWYDHLYNNTANTGLCSAVDFNSLSGHQCSNAGSDVCVNASSRYYQCTGTTNFKRTISVVKHGDLDVAGNYLEITCEVTWNGRTTTATDILYNNSY